MNVFVSIIIVNFNTKELLKNCLESVFEHTLGITFEIIVVDNASIDGSQEMIVQNYPTVKLIKLNDNIGFGRANNEGVKIANGKYLFFLNSDTELKNNAVEIFTKYMEYHINIDKIGAIGTLLLDYNDNITHSYGHYPNIRKDLISELKTLIVDIYGRERFIKNKSKLLNKKNCQNPDNLVVDYITGADLFMSKELFLKFEGFDPFFFMYFEETDLQYRIKNEGYKCIIINGPKIRHLEGASFKKKNNKLSNLRRLYFDKSNFYFYKKHFNSMTYYSYRFAHCIIQLFSIFDSSHKYFNRIKYIKFIFTHNVK